VQSLRILAKTAIRESFPACTLTLRSVTGVSASATDGAISRHTTKETNRFRADGIA
jgi:hypothetical protein